MSASRKRCCRGRARAGGVRRVRPNEVLRRGARRAHVEAVDSAEGDHPVLMHLGVQCGGGATQEAEELLSEEKEGRRACLRRAHRTDAVLHLHRRRVGTAFDLETREAAEGKAKAAEASAGLAQ